MTTVEKSRSTRTEAAEIMPFGGWENTPRPPGSVAARPFSAFRRPTTQRRRRRAFSLMSLYAAALGLAGVGVGVRAMVTVIGGTAFWYVPALCLLGLASVALVGRRVPFDPPTGAAVAAVAGSHGPAGDRRADRGLVLGPLRSIARRAEARLSGPELAFEGLFGIGQGAAVGARGQVFPAAVGDHEGDVGPPARLTASCATASAACRIAPVEKPAKMPSTSTSCRVRSTASRVPTEKRRVSTVASYSSGRSPRRCCAGRRPARRSAARPRRSGCPRPSPAGSGRCPSACRWCRGRPRSG